MTGMWLASRVALVILVMIAAAAVVVAAWLAVRRVWQAIRPHPGRHPERRGDRQTAADRAAIPGTTEHAAAAFLGAPTTETIPIAPTAGRPPWAGDFYAEPLPAAPPAPSRRWETTDQTRAVVVDPGWDEPGPGAPSWAEIKLPSLDDMLGYAYPGGFPPCHHDPAQRADRLFDGLPWAGDPGPASPAELDALRFELLETADLDADCVYALMGGDS